MLTPVRRIITLPEDDGLVVSYPDTLEIIRRPAPVTVPVEPSRPDPSPSDDFHEPLVRTAPDQAPEQAPEEAPEGPAETAQEHLENLLQQYRDDRARRRSVRAGKVLVAALAGGLLAVWLLHPPVSGGNENRAQTAFPSLSPGGLTSGKNYRQADAALRDRLALRQYVVKAVGQAARDKMSTSLNPEVVMGPTGVPFISEDFNFPCQYAFDPAAVDTGLRELRALGRTTGKTITVAIAPDKSSILTDQLGNRAGALMACSNRVRRQTESTWNNTATSPVLYTWEELAAEQKAHPGKVFQRGDSHWTSQGALTWSHALIKRLIAQDEAPAALRTAPVAVEVADQPADNDLYRLMGISRSETVPVWQVTRPHVKLSGKSIPSPSGRGTAVFHATSEHEPLITGRTLVINDSFFSRAEGQLAPYFSNLKVLHWSDFMTDVSNGTLPHFDRIIIETVQRGWPERAGWLQAGQPIHDALAKELSQATDTAAVPAPEPAASS
jgi:hypothetical protein